MCARIPQSVVCLLTALEVREVGTQKPRPIWVAIPHKARMPSLGRLPVWITRFSSAALTHGVERTEFEGVPTTITTAARTVVDRTMGTIFEELIRRFNEVLDENPGDHFTPRDVVHLMVDLMLAGDEERIAGRAVRSV